MKLKIPLISTLFLLLFTNCGLISTFKVIEAYETESLGNRSFYEEINFREINGMIIIQVAINGRQENFILDTGATSSLDVKLAEKLSIKPLGRIKTFDVNGKKKHIKYGTIDKVKIGNIAIHDMVVSTTDLEQLNTAACLNVTGIIGANAMNKCIWQIDYHTQTIIITNEREQLNFSDQARTINFSAVGKGVPQIALYSKDKYFGEAIFDTGSNGYMSLGDNYLDPSSDFVEMQSCIFGIQSMKITNQKIAVIPSLQFNKELSLDNQVVTFQENRPLGIIGNRFLKNYKVTFDWMYQQILLEPYDPEPKATFRRFDFSPRFVDDKLVIGALRPNSTLYNTGIRLNDEILSINGITFNENPHEQYCRFLAESKNWQTVKLVVKKGEEEVELVVEKLDALELIMKDL